MLEWGDIEMPTGTKRKEGNDIIIFQVKFFWKNNQNDGTEIKRTKIILCMPRSSIVRCELISRFMKLM